MLYSNPYHLCITIFLTTYATAIYIVYVVYIVYADIYCWGQHQQNTLDRGYVLVLSGLYFSILPIGVINHLKPVHT